tara:strand:+ start:642 stop:815 length:174 start_codon:yes stop_codon:yes gene_type:complete
MEHEFFNEDDKNFLILSNYTLRELVKKLEKKIEEIEEELTELRKENMRLNKENIKKD